jgi:hypothetical protein
MKRNVRTIKGFLAVVVTVMSVIGVVNTSWAIKSGLVNADSNNPFVQTYLTGTGMFASSDLTYVDAKDSTPTLAELSSFDSVLVWNNDYYKNPTELGNVLADYVDAGGGVVLATFSFYPVWVFPIAGRLMTDTTYSPYSVSSSDWSTASLGTYNSSHPLMSGISSITGYSRDVVDVNPGAEVVARWTDGTPFVATNHGGKVVGITVWPGDKTMTGDYPRLFANALQYSANPQSSVVPEPSSFIGLGLPLLMLGLRRFTKIRK